MARSQEEAPGRGFCATFLAPLLPSLEAVSAILIATGPVPSFLFLTFFLRVFSALLTANYYFLKAF